MSNIIKKREFVELTTYQHIFDSVGIPGHGYFVDAKDSLGNIDHKDSRALEGYLERVNAGELIYAGLKSYTAHWVEPAILRCDCNRDVVLDGFTNTCACGADYNASGQRLAGRSQWGEETGEHISDILNIR